MITGTVLGALDVTAPVLWALRVTMAIAGALLGWFLTGPVVKLLYRGAFQRPLPGWVMPWTRLGGAALVGLLLGYLLPLGSGSGFGWGPGGGGAGPGARHDPADAADGKPAAADAAAKTAAQDLEALEIEVVGGKRYQGSGRFYLIGRREPAVPLEKVEDYLKKNQERLAEYITIVLTSNQSVDVGHAAVLRLNTVIEKYKKKPQVKDVDAEPGK
jgi:hypothetical protein